MNGIRLYTGLAFIPLDGRFVFTTTRFDQTSECIHRKAEKCDQITKLPHCGHLSGHFIPFSSLSNGPFMRTLHVREKQPAALRQLFSEKFRNVSRSSRMDGDTHSSGGPATG